ncbi:MAG: DUF308 domain-containing protein [Eubacterium sp.]|nr:DUF308 domain-containing protein [Eubacterium sp.]
MARKAKQKAVKPPKTFLHRLKTTATVWSFVMIAIGVFCLLRPEDILIILCRLIGLALLVFGLILIISAMIGMSTEGERGANFPTSSLIIGLIIAAIGAFIVFKPNSIVSFISILIAVFLFFYGINDLTQMQMMYRYQDSGWWIALIGGVIAIALGLLIVMNPFGTGNLIVRVAGVSLIYAGVSGFVINMRCSRFERKFYRAEAELKAQLAGEVIDVTDSAIEQNEEAASGQSPYSRPGEDPNNHDDQDDVDDWG